MDPRIERCNRIDAMPPFKFVWGRDWIMTPHGYAFGLVWDKNLYADEGEYIYRKRLILHLTFRMWLEKP